jgi:hypothetical protein
MTSPRWLAQLQDLAVQHRHPQAIDVLVDEDEVAFDQRRHHRGRGMRKGSYRKERTTSTSRIIGKNDREYSTITGSRGFCEPSPPGTTVCIRRGLKNSESISQMTR